MSSKRMVWENLATGASGDIEVEREFLKVFGEMYDLFCAKQRDYGRGNIHESGHAGVIVRTSDKLARLKHLAIRVGTPMEPANESIEDTWLDVANYGMIGLMVLRGRWPAPVEP